MNFEKIQLHNVDFEDLIKVIHRYTGDGYLETADGDSLNLKSKLCQILGLSTILASTEIEEAWFVAQTKMMKLWFFALICMAKCPINY